MRPTPSTNTRRWLAACCALALSLASCRARDGAVASAEPGRLFPFCEAGQWGYIDARGRVVVPPRYAGADDYSDGRARVVIDRRVVGFLDEHGQLAFTLPHWTGSRFAEGLAAYSDGSREDKYGYIDRRGEVVIEAAYDQAHDFSGGLAEVNVGAKLDRSYRPARRRGGASGFVDRTGRLAIPIRFGVDYGGFSDGLAHVWDEGRAGYIDPRGEFVITRDDLQARLGAPGRYIRATGPFHEGLAAVITDSADTTALVDGTLVGFIDKAGRFVIPPRFTNAHDFSEGLAAVADGSVWGYTDRGGRVVVPCRYERAGEFSGGLAAVRQDGRWSYIDRRGEVVLSGPWNEARRFGGALARVHEGGRLEDFDHVPPAWAGGEWSYIDRSGRRVHLYGRDEDMPGHFR